MAEGKPANGAFVLVAAGAVAALAGTDLVLPAVPELASILRGTLEQAQWVLASFVAGTAFGLLLFGELGSRFSLRWMLIGSLIGYAGLSLVASLSESIWFLSVVRFLQGLSAAGAAVFGPVILKALFSEEAAIRRMGLLGSLESMAPALAPVLGAWLLVQFGWRSTFYVIAIVALMVAAGWLWRQDALKGIVRSGSPGSYRALLASREYLAFAFSQAFTLGGLLIFVFGAPTVITVALGGDISDFVVMQVIGIAFFVLFSNTAHLIVARLGNFRTILLGSVIAATGSVCLWVYAAFGGDRVEVIWALFVLVNAGLGVRGPPGFYKAIQVSGDNDARGSALVVLASLMTAAAGTVLVAPFIQVGLFPLSSVAALVSIASPLLLLALRRDLRKAGSEE